MDRWINDDYFGLVCPDCDKPPLNCHCEEEAERIKKIILEFLRTMGIVAFDMSECGLTPELEEQVKGRG